MKTPLKNDAGVTKSVGIWIRVSTDEQAQGDSPEHHEARARSYAEAKGWTVRELYDLAGFSGKSVMEIPETKRMMADIRRGHISGLIFSKLARVARNTKELLSFSEFFQEHRADLISIEEAIDTSSPAGRLFFTLQAALAQFEREEIASRVAASVPIRAKLGKPLGGQAPYGFAWKDGRLVVVPEDAAVLKTVFELFAQHKRKRTVSRMLNDRGMRTRGGKRWSDTTLDRVISDTSAKGEYRRNYTKSLGNGKAWTIKPEHEWVIQNVERIVPEELWETCNGILVAMATGRKVPAKRGKNPFTGLVFCHCGKPMYVPSNTPKWVCYSCRNKIPAVDLEELFRDELKSFTTDSGKVADYLAKARGGAAEKKAILSGLKRDKEKAQEALDKCFELYQAGAITIGQFKDRFNPIDLRKKELEREIPSVEGEIAALVDEDLTAESVASEGSSFYDNWPSFDLDKKRSVAELVLKSIVVGKEDISFNHVRLPSLEMMTVGQHNPTGSSRPPA